MTRKTPKIIEDAVTAWRLYAGSNGLRARTQQRFYDLAVKKTQKVLKTYSLQAPQHLYEQILARATFLGPLTPKPAKDY